MTEQTFDAAEKLLERKSNLIRVKERIQDADRYGKVGDLNIFYLMNENCLEEDMAAIASDLVKSCVAAIELKIKQVTREFEEL